MNESYKILEIDNDSIKSEKFEFTLQIKKFLSSLNKIIIYSGIFSLGLILSVITYSVEVLDYKIISSFNSFDIGQLSQILNLILGILVIPIISSLSDILGRGIVLAISLIFYIVGSLIIGFSLNFLVYSLGFIINGVGETIKSLIIPIILSDLLSARDKSFGFILYWAPNLLSLGISIPIVKLVENGDKWKFLYFSQIALVIFSGVPILLGLFRIQSSDRSRYSKLSKLSALKQIDLAGILLLTIGLGFILTPFALVIRLEKGFASPAIFIPIIIGSLLLLVFIIWEIKFAKSPLITHKFIHNRAAVTIIIIRAFLQFDQTLTFQYMNAYLALSRSITAYDVNLINLGYKLPWFIMGFLFALIIRKIRDIRPIIWVSIGIYAIGVGLTIPSRNPDTSVAVVTFVEGIIGSGAGISACASLVILQTCINQTEIASIMAIDTLLTNCFSSIASAVAAIIWTKSLSQNLLEKLPSDYKSKIPELIADTDKLVKLPEDVKLLWIQALSDSQWLICTVSIIFACVCFVIALTLPRVEVQFCEVNEGELEEINNESKEKLLN